MRVTGARDHIAHVDLSSLSRVQRADSRVDIRAQGAQLGDVIEYVATDLYLIGFREPLKLVDDNLKCVCHT
jgi:hypothetical protein